MLGSDLRNQLTDSAVASIGNKATGLGTAVTAAGWLTLNNIALIGGLLIAVAGFVVNWIYRHREDERLAARHRAEAEWDALRRENLRQSGRHDSVCDE
jgi:hypothetical protein